MAELTILRGDDQNIPLTFTDSDGTAINLTGATVFFTAKELLTDTDANAVAQLSWTSHTAPTSGQTTIPVTNAASSGWSTGRFFWNCRIVHSDGTVQSTDTDLCIIKAEVTRSTS